MNVFVSTSFAQHSISKVSPAVLSQYPYAKTPSASLKPGNPSITDFTDSFSGKMQKLWYTALNPVSEYFHSSATPYMFLAYIIQYLTWLFIILFVLLCIWIVFCVM